MQRVWRSWCCGRILLCVVLVAQLPCCLQAAQHETNIRPPARRGKSEGFAADTGLGGSVGPQDLPLVRSGRVTPLGQRLSRTERSLEDGEAGSPEAFKIRAHTADHAFFLAPFQDEALNTVFDASSSVWTGYQGEQEDGSINAAAGAAYRVAIEELRDKLIPTGGRILDNQATPTTYSWNSPTTGGTTLSIFGLGFGWVRKEGNQCSAGCLADPSQINCPLEECFYMDAQVGNTQPKAITWFSDSSLSMVLSPGSGAGLDVKVIAGSFSKEARLPSFFTYDTPKESKIEVANAPTSGATDITVFGDNFGPENSEVSIKVGETLCTSASWMSDSTLKCGNLRRGTGSQHTVQVAIEGAFDSPDARKSEAGFPKSFSYDRPTLTHVNPNHGPPSGYSTLITMFGQNFGMGPEVQQLCPGNRVDREYILDVTEERSFFCASGFPRFSIAQTIPNPDGGDDIPFELLWDNIRPFALAFDPISCAQNTYRCDVLRLDSTCQFIKDSCKPISDLKTLTDAGQTGTRLLRTTCDELDEFAEKIECPSHWVSGYMNDGISCTRTAVDGQTDYFEHPASDVPSTAFLCQSQPKYLGQCPTCSRLGCCNEPGTLGATVEGTECVALIWNSDSTLFCKAPPGIGPGRAMSVAIDDNAGEQVALLNDAFSYDGPIVSQISPRDAVPTSGGAVVTFQGSNFGTFQCNSTWCSFDETLLNCNRTHCSDGSVKLSKSISHYGSLKATYDGPDAFRTACASAAWTSDSSISCAIPKGTGDLRVAALTVFRTVNRYSVELQDLVEDRSIAYEQPQITAIEPNLVPSVGAVNISVYGRNFGNWDTQPLSRLAGTQCLDTLWVSDTKLVCLAPRGISPPLCQLPGTAGPAGCRDVVCNTCPDGASDKVCPYPYETHPQLSSQGVCRGMVVTVSALRGYITQAFTYESGVITALAPTNGPPVGNFNVTILGRNFGDKKDYGYSSAVGGSDCTQVYWISDSSVACVISKGSSFGHTPRIAVEWNEQVILQDILFSYDKPLIRSLDPLEIPSSGGVDITISGKNFGSQEEFLDPNRVITPQPPKATVGDTPCSVSQWTSDSTVICSIASLGRGQGPGVGGNLPMELELGALSGLYVDPFGYSEPGVVQAGAKNGPALGGNMFFVTGDEFGVYDYSPTASIGSTDCRLSRWSSNTAVECMAATCTTFLAGRNAELPIRVKVGLAHRLDSDQIGELLEAYTYDLPVEQNFALNNVEINFLCFSLAAFFAGIIVCMLHVRYRKLWPTPAPSLPVRYSRTGPSDQHKIKVNPKLRLQTREELEKQAKKAGDKANLDEATDSSSSSEGSDFYEFEQKDLKPDQMDEAFHRGMQAALGIGEDGAEEDPKDPYQTPLLGKDVVTGQAIKYDPKEQGETGAGVGFVQAPIESVITPAPRAHKGHAAKGPSEDRV